MPTTTMSSMTSEEELKRLRKGLLPAARAAAQPAPNPAAQPPAFDRNAAATGVTNLYRELLGRDPKQAGLDYWVGDLEGGSTMDQVAANMRLSPEYGGIASSAIKGMYQQWLGRDAERAGLDYWVDQAQQGQSLADIEANIRRSPEAQAYAAGIAAQNAATQIPAATQEVNTGGAQSSVSQAAQEAATYDPTVAASPGTAEAEDAEVTTRDVQPEETVQYQLQQIIDSDSPLMDRARTAGLQYANQRGLLNSSIAAQASQAAMLDAATRIAEADASTYAGAAGQSTEALNRAALQDAQLGTGVSQFNVSERGTQNRFNAQAINEAGQFNAQSANQAIQNFLQREAQRQLQDDQQLFTAEENAADRELRRYLQESQFDFQSTQNDLDRDLQETLQKNQQVFQLREGLRERAFQRLEANKQRIFQRYMFDSEMDWNSAENALQREFDKYRTDSQAAATVMYSTMESIASIYADPNLTSAQKMNAIRNVMDSANSMPALLSRIQAGMGSEDAGGGSAGGSGALTDQDLAIQLGYTQVVGPNGNPVENLWQDSNGQTFRYNPDTGEFEDFQSPLGG